MLPTKEIPKIAQDGHLEMMGIGEGEGLSTGQPQECPKSFLSIAELRKKIHVSLFPALNEIPSTQHQHTTHTT